MSEDQSPLERGRELLSQAFKRCEIPKSSRKYPKFGRNIYWQTTGSDIAIIFSQYHMGAGAVYCSISLGHLAKQAADSFADDEEAIAALVDVFKYLESVVSTLLPATHHSLLRRMFNLKVRPKTDKEQQKAWIALLDQLTPAYSDNRAQMERKLAAERDWRGGSGTRLKPEVRSSLHVQYDELHKIAREAKKDYNRTLKAFEKTRRGRGYPRKEWQTYWRNYLAGKYPPELISEFLEAFASEDNPSASDVAYLKLSKHTTHTRSYLPQLVSDSRKASKSKDNQS